MTDNTAPRTAGSETAGKVLSALHGFLVGMFGLAYAFIVWNAIFYLTQMAQAGISGYGWVVLLLPAIVPMIVFIVALALSRRRSIGVFVLVMLAGLALSAVFWLDTLSYALRNGASLLN
ncbi:hypothetical protein [Microbacterium sp. H1-D42]|uniref:hypothetical protein n=1 Tax=Microbacterium sp. H1-D42 TaxID=2925844 RepID=UPI001F53699A|nr:hypothetical protein [Microbacterium sp. H1-D42]UNK69463.1 hypothetical protein MNR00_09725 [Microbacterium sp. H1-D42]